MHLTPEQIKFYVDNGYLLLQEQFVQNEIAQMKAELPGVFAEDSPRRVIEKDGHTVRSVYGCHTTNEVFWKLVRDPRVLHPAEQLIGSELYVYQFKLNAKAAFGGDIWEWHQDYIFWLKEDGMPEPRVANVTVFLDDVTELNGPMFVLPGSHREGVIDPAASGTQANDEALKQNAYTESPAWITNLTASLKHSLGRETIAGLIQRHGCVAPKGPAGSILFFHPNIVHGSPTNMSPFNRVLALITYNSIANIPKFPERRRPEFLASSECVPLRAHSFDEVVSVSVKADIALSRAS